MEIINQLAEAYALKYSSSTDELLKEVEMFTMNRGTHTNMLSGPLQGKLLEMISKMVKPEKILEIGTFTGYSALCLAKGLASDGQLHTIELMDEDASVAEGFFAKSSQSHQIILHRGNALEIIPSLTEEWDLVFIDADKVNYIAYYELTLPRLKNSGIMLVDNVLFHGQVLEENISGKNPKAIQAFNDYIAAQKNVEQVILTVRDGLMMIIKK